MKIAVVGATGEVGRTFLKLFEEFSLAKDITDLRLFASERSQGQLIKVGSKEYRVETLTEDHMKEKYDYIFFSAGAKVSAKFAPIAQEYGNTIIDNSSQFRMDPKIPLIVPEINGELLKNYKGIIANPNCSTIQMVLALNGIYKKIGLDEIVVSTYQSVSGAGNKGIIELFNQQKGIDEIKHFPKIIKNNVIPLIGDELNNGFTSEEVKMINETHKIFSDNNIKVYPTTVRVPVVYGHSESVLIKTKSDVELSELIELINSTPNVQFTEEIITPYEVAGSDTTYVSRLRKPEKNCFLMWIVADNIRVGAATNALRILFKHKELNIKGN
ncbi:aspartate-semialdehyde dehydrogenase [Petrotoga sp. 9PWA.NaAc.5.4]|uniref:aspartate-semialdehyde dehydrogenase n=1 Tax=Petrotoga sp. 9PWA.NaAc.5.4 TaxID=1434328 RepID=UPI000CAB227E|nr:aspartate-semialdehyde dehydrogenase [Petrotoga sp. 9PWA.NaAc.5.4]PNR94461.1 aspartate-semialdehyde dehydrogenase [Petrotoga sp. 9PWA.NaAc.5.4]